MVALTRMSRLDFGGEGAESARLMIKSILAIEPDATRRVYAALAHKVWTLLVERRFDGEIRDWHALLDSVKYAIRPRDEAAAERVTALGDLLRESISLAETSPARAVANRPHARRILEILDEAADFVPRRRLLETLGLGTSHLSNVLTQLLAHSLVERRDRGKEAEFNLTPLGREIMGAGAAPEKAAEANIPANLLEKLIAEVRQGFVFPLPREMTSLHDQLVLGESLEIANDRSVMWPLLYPISRDSTDGYEIGTIQFDPKRTRGGALLTLTR